MIKKFIHYIKRQKYIIEYEDDEDILCILEQLILLEGSDPSRLELI